MSEKDEMTIDERRKYLHKMWGRYRLATKKEKGCILDEIEHVTGLHRKSIIRILNGRLSRKKRTSERGPTYGTDVVNAVVRISKALDHPCAERLKPNLVFIGKHMMRHQQIFIDEDSLKGKGIHLKRPIPCGRSRMTYPTPVTLRLIWYFIAMRIILGSISIPYK